MTKTPDPESITKAMRDAAWIATNGTREQRAGKFTPPASTIEVIETALRQATWDATKGPARLRAGRFDPEPSAATGKAPKRPA